MELTEEIQEAARKLGQALREDDFVRGYLEAVEAVQRDPAARELEEQFLAAAKAYVGREKAGEAIGAEERKRLAELRHQAHMNELISRREAELEMIKPYLAGVADEISQQLGMDYAMLARPEDLK